MWLLNSWGCSSTPSSHLNGLRPFPTGERIYLVRYNPCGCHLGEALFDLELSEIPTKFLTELIELPTQELTQELTQASHQASSKKTVSALTQTHLNEQALKGSPTFLMKLNQSAHLAKRFQNSLIFQNSLSNRRSSILWERVEVIGEAAKQRRIFTDSKRINSSTSPLILKNNQTALTDHDSMSNEAKQWRILWSWWANSPNQQLILRVNLEGLSKQFSGHILRQVELLEVVSDSPKSS